MGQNKGFFWGLPIGGGCPLSWEASPLACTHESVVPTLFQLFTYGRPFTASKIPSRMVAHSVPTTAG